MKKKIKFLFEIALFLGTPITFLSALWLKFVKRMGVNKTNDKIFMKLGIFPILDHYYQPLINPKKHLTKSLRADRELAGIDFNKDEQLSLLSKFNYNEELLKFPLEKRDEVGYYHKNALLKEQNIEYYYNNSSFTSGDGEYLYNMVRHFKPAKIIEIGSGLSTLMILNAISQNKTDDVGYQCKHICIEPYEKQWLKKMDIELLSKKVEDVDKTLFEELGPNDILFIDSSHIIRPQGDVLFEFLEVLPILKSGVIIHVHDVFSPKDYRDEWVYEQHLLWNEQYILEAFLMFNSKFKVLGALNYLTHNYRKELADKCPVFKNQLTQEPGSFWMMRN